MGNFMPESMMRFILADCAVQVLSSPLLALAGEPTMTEQDARATVENLTTEQLQKIILSMPEDDDA